MSIWEECEGINCVKALNLEPWRVVESQHVSSSRDLVDSREEHDILEDLLEKSKPQIENNLHYLIFTPFRYPPLDYGSRFGNVFEPSLWYGSLEIYTALREVAFYRLKFFDDTSADLAFVEIPMTTFRATIQTQSGIDLTEMPFKSYQDKISHKNSYEDSQKLGSDMRASNIEAFVFTSARDQLAGKNVAAFTSKAFKTKDDRYVTMMQNWRCIANQNIIEFTRDEITHREFHEFAKDEFPELGLSN